LTDFVQISKNLKKTSPGDEVVVVDTNIFIAIYRLFFVFLVSLSTIALLFLPQPSKAERYSSHRFTVFTAAAMGDT